MQASALYGAMQSGVLAGTFFAPTNEAVAGAAGRGEHLAVSDHAQQQPSHAGTACLQPQLCNV